MDEWNQLEFVPPEEREAVRNFESESEAQLAAGFLRAQGIAAQMGTEMIPGLPAGLAIWVGRADLERAKALLDQIDRSQGAEAAAAAEEEEQETEQ